MANSSPFLQRWTPVLIWGVGIAAVIGLLLVANEFGYLGGNKEGYFEFMDRISQRVDQLIQEGKADKAILEIGEALPNSPGKSELLVMRGATHFRMGAFEESVKDFDKCIELEPRVRPFLWQRGVSLFYARKYKEAKQQFESFLEVSPNNVETSFWHFMCNAMQNGLEVAKQELHLVEDDPRTPMMSIQKLIQGTAQPTEVLEDVDRAPLPSGSQRIALFNGYLYSGLYYGLVDDKAKSKEMLNKCLELNIPGYMSDLAKHHLVFLEK